MSTLNRGRTKKKKTGTIFSLGPYWSFIVLSKEGRLVRGVGLLITRGSSVRYLSVTVAPVPSFVRDFNVLTKDSVKFSVY